MTGFPRRNPLQAILSGQLRTNQLPGMHVSVGYLWWTTRFNHP